MIMYLNGFEKDAGWLKICAKPHSMSRCWMGSNHPPGAEPTGLNQLPVPRAEYQNRCKWTTEICHVGVPFKWWSKVGSWMSPLPLSIHIRLPGTEWAACSIPYASCHHSNPLMGPGWQRLTASTEPRHWRWSLSAHWIGGRQGLQQHKFPAGSGSPVLVKSLSWFHRGENGSGVLPSKVLASQSSLVCGKWSVWLPKRSCTAVDKRDGKVRTNSNASLPNSLLLGKGGCTTAGIWQSISIKMLRFA